MHRIQNCSLFDTILRLISRCERILDLHRGFYIILYEMAEFYVFFLINV